MQRLVFYARVSTEEEKQQNALVNQIESLRNYINSISDFELVDEYIDSGKSGTTTAKRDEYNRLYNDLLIDKFDILVVTHLDRLTRTEMDWYLFVDRVNKQSKRIYFLSNHKFYQPGDELTTGIEAIMAAEFSRKLSKKVNDGHRHRQSKGIPVTNGRMWGYDQINKQLVINKQEAEIVKRIFEMYANEGVGFRIIQQRLEEMGIKNRNGKPFSLTTLKRLIRNETYKGTLVQNKRHKDFNTKQIIDNPPEEWIIHENAVPVIVSAELWEKANSQLDKKKKDFGIDEKQKIAGYFQGSYTYSGKIKCGKCQRPFWHQTNTGRKVDLWQCSGYRQFGKNSSSGCESTSIHTYILDDIIKEVVFEFWSNKETNIEKVIDALNQVLNQNNYNETVKKLSEDKYKLEQRKDKLIDMLTDDLITKEEYKKKKEEVDKQLENINKTIEMFEEKNRKILDKKTRMEEIERKLKKQFSNKDGMDEEIIKDFLKQIVVKSKDELEIVLNGDFNYMAQKVDNEWIYADVSAIRQNRYSAYFNTGRISRDS